MSILETPRIVFRGAITWDPIVTNNYPSLYDESTAENVPTGQRVAEFRKRAIDGVNTTKGIWNVDGTHRSIFFDTTIESVDTGSGVTTTDPFVKAPVSFAGMLVDTEPYGSDSSQLFFDSMSFGIQGGCRVFAPRSSRMIARYINFARNTGPTYIAGLASIVWQTSFPKDAGLTVDAYDSDALSALKKALQDDDVLGLTVRWNAYRTIYFDRPDLTKGSAANAEVYAALKQELESGGFQPNPARSLLVGVLGLWRKGEPACVPGDRALVQVDTAIGSANARLAGSTLTLDLSNSIPEINGECIKQDLGPLTVVAVEPDGKTVAATLGTFPYTSYDREAYNSTGGLVTLTVDADAASKAADRDLELRKADGSVLLHETALRACPEVPNLYLDEGESSALRVLVLDRGQIPKSPVQVMLATPNPAVADTSSIATTSASGIATFTTKGQAGSVVSYVLLPYWPNEEKPSIPTEVDTQVNAYMVIRTLPADDDLDNIAPTWENVHAHVLAGWEAMAPCMDNWLRLGDPEQVKAYGAVVKRLTAKENFESFRFMPVTRDLSAGKRTLLYKWLDHERETPTNTTSRVTSRTRTLESKREKFRK